MAKSEPQERMLRERRAKVREGWLRMKAEGVSNPMIEARLAIECEVSASTIRYDLGILGLRDTKEQEGES